MRGGDEEGRCPRIWESGHACPVLSRRRDVKLTSLAVTREAAAKDTGRTHKCSRLSLRCHELAGSPISGGDLIILVRADG